MLIYSLSWTYGQFASGSKACHQAVDIYNFRSHQANESSVSIPTRYSSLQSIKASDVPPEAAPDTASGTGPDSDADLEREVDRDFERSTAL